VILEEGLKDLRSKTVTVFPIVPRSPVDLGEIREIKVESSIWLEFGEPVLQGNSPVVYVFQAVAGKDIIDLAFGKVISSVAVLKDFVNANRSRKFPFFFRKANVVSNTLTEVTSKWDRELCGISLGLESWVDVSLKGDEVHLQERQEEV
jgi:hypothetical protein